MKYGYNRPRIDFYSWIFGALYAAFFVCYERQTNVYIRTELALSRCYGPFHSSFFYTDNEMTDGRDGGKPVDMK